MYLPSLDQCVVCGADHCTALLGRYAEAGVDALTVGLAKELAEEGIRVNAVAPGIVRTHIHAAAGDPHRADRVASRIPFGRAGQPEEISGAIRWLFSDEASYVSGAVLRISGGL